MVVFFHFYPAGLKPIFRSFPDHSEQIRGSPTVFGLRSQPVIQKCTWIHRVDLDRKQHAEFRHFDQRIDQRSAGYQLHNRRLPQDRRFQSGARRFRKDPKQQVKNEELIEPGCLLQKNF